MSGKNTPPATHLGRYARVSGALGGAASRYLGQKIFGKEINHQDQANAFAALMGDLKGPVMKIAQFLSTIPDAIPDEYAQAFQTLQSQAPPMGAYFVKRRLQGELGPQWAERFSSFDLRPSAAASLGQVHKAISLEGAPLACKLQYPDMQTVVSNDIGQLRWALKFYESSFGALKTDALFHEIVARLKEELDYQHEAQNLLTFEAIFKKTPQVHVPTYYPNLSTQHLLTLSWLEGKSFQGIEDSPQDYRDQLAQNMFYAWYMPLYHHGVLHGDPHLGNYTFREDASINLLDFGCVRRFDAAFIQSIIDLYKALQSNREDDLAAAYTAWGFENLSKDLIQALNLWARMLYEPLLEDRVRPIQKDNRGIEGRERLEKVHIELRRLGGVRPPAEFVFLDRAAVGMGSLFMRLKTEQNWHRLFHELIDSRPA